jgi:hypothetical protein
VPLLNCVRLLARMRHLIGHVEVAIIGGPGATGTGRPFDPRCSPLNR